MMGIEMTKPTNVPEGAEACWYCYWGWPKAVKEIHDRIEKEIDEKLDKWIVNQNLWRQPYEPISGFNALRFGPAHLVWEDENWDCIDYCIKDCDSERFSKWPIFAINLVKKSLLELKALGKENIKVCPADYDGWNAQDYPPPAGVEMVQK